MYSIKQLTKTCGACPARWSGTTYNDEEVYVRYRWGCLTISVNEQVVFQKQLGDDLDGSLSYEELRKATYEHFNWVCEEE